ncbi:MAG: hypothetical protein ACYS7Y_16515 [Planctomycetota bacterium]|jgi:hypothetical protein
MSKEVEPKQYWFWEGNLNHVLGKIKGDEEKWLVEKGVLHTEDDEQPGVKDLIEGDVVFRIRTVNALEDDDPREKLFAWWTVNVETGMETIRPF